MSEQLSEKLLQRFVDGEVTEDQDRAIRLHLRESEDERARVLDALRTRHALSASASPVPAVPPGFAARVAREAFSAEARARHELSHVLPIVRRLSFLAVAAVLCLAVLWLFVRRFEDWAAEPEVGANQVLSVKDFSSPHDSFLRAPEAEPSAEAGHAAAPRGNARPEQGNDRR
ncbi:MAG: hypothetical protein IPN34_20715 [Planctomycetes bacterium]|nr:hypothetical protein [Planctomycetota bacterium]